MSKWLTAARKKLGGKFPRDKANQEVDKYTRKLKQFKAKKTKKALKEVSEADKRAAQEEGRIYTAATKALAMRWLRMAKDVLDIKFRARTENLTDETEKILQQMPEEDDWYFGSSTRLEGYDILKKGRDLESDRVTLEAESAIKINKIKNDIELYVKERGVEIENERKNFETKWAQKRDRLKVDIDMRMAELVRAKEIRKREFVAEEKRLKEEYGAAPSDVIQSHRDQLMAFDVQMLNERREVETKGINEYCICI